MTRREICEAIEAETHSRTWAAASIELRLDVIEDWILAGEAGEESKGAAKKKTRKPRAKPLAQAAAAGEDE